MKSTKIELDPHPSLAYGQARAQAGLSSLQADGPSILATSQACFPKFHVETPLLPQIDKLTSTGQAFGLSKVEISRTFEHAIYDGILGLAYPSLAMPGTTAVFDNLKKQGQISEPVFAFYLST